jgi:hypothetical protein
MWALIEWGIVLGLLPFLWKIVCLVTWLRLPEDRRDAFAQFVTALSGWPRFKAPS